MNQSNLSFDLSPVGYLVVRKPNGPSERDELNKELGRYRGVDRLPPFIAPEPEIRAILGIPPVEDEVLIAALHDWFDSRSETNAFIPCYEKAIRLLKTFELFGFSLELIFCQLAFQKGEERRMESYSVVEPGSESMCLRYGFDVSWPSCNHSAILQPGIVPNNWRWREKLNEYGLLDNYSDAVMLREEYIAIYPYPPFDIFLIHGVGPHGGTGAGSDSN